MLWSAASCCQRARRRRAGRNRFRLDDYFTELTILPDSPFSARRSRRSRPTRAITSRSSAGCATAGSCRGHSASGGSTGRRAAGPHDAGRDRGLSARSPASSCSRSSSTATKRRQPKATSRRSWSCSCRRWSPPLGLVGRTIGEIDFRRRYGAIVVGLGAGSGWLEQELSQIRLRAGDVLVLQGDDEALGRVAARRGFLMLVPFQGGAKPRARRRWPASIMLATVACRGAECADDEIAALAGAVAMVLRLYLPTPGATARSTRASTSSSPARFRWARRWRRPARPSCWPAGCKGAVGGWSQPWSSVDGLRDRAAVLTQFMSDAATTALLRASSVRARAARSGQPPEAYVVTVAMAAVAAFLTPIGHHGNLLVYGPGRLSSSPTSCGSARR